jgi:hypothetical protein
VAFGAAVCGAAVADGVAATEGVGVAVAAEEGRLAARRGRVAERQLAGGDDDRRDRERDQAGHERDDHLSAGEEPAAAVALVLVEPERIVGVLRIDLDPLLLRIHGMEVAARRLPHRGALRRLAPDGDLLDLGDRAPEALGDESDDDWCDGGGHDAPASPQQWDHDRGRGSGRARNEDGCDRYAAGLLAAHPLLR